MNPRLPALKQPSRILLPRLICAQCARHLSLTPPRPSGHNHWSTIKHDKARQDANRSRQRQSLSRDISDASRQSGPDVGTNARLASVVAGAKRAGMPRAGIEAAIARGQGKSSGGVALERVVIEAVVPPVALIVDCQTESKARTLVEVRALVKASGGTPTPTSYLFEKRGRVLFCAREGTGVEEVLEVALEAGALDVVLDEQGRIVVDTEYSALKEVENKIAQSVGLEVASSEFIWYPNSETRVEKEGMQAESLVQLGLLQDELQKVPEVQGVYMNFDLEAGMNEMNRIDDAG